MKSLPIDYNKKELNFEKAFFLLAATAVLCIGFSYYLVSNFLEKNKTFNSRINKMLELKGTIVHLDEVLTMSTKMASFSEKPTIWEDRYKKHEGKLDMAIASLISISGKEILGENAEKTNLANLKLVALEKKSFQLIREGKASKAKELLNSDEYELQKSIYKKGMIKLSDQISEKIARENDNLKEMKSYLFLYLEIIFLVFFLGQGLIIFTLIRKKKKLESELKPYELDKAQLALAGQMSGAMSHEVGSPLAAIRFNQSLLLNYLKDNKNAEVHAILEENQKSIKQCFDIMDQLENLSRNYVDKKWEKESIKTIINHSLDLAHVHLKVNEIENIEIDLEGSPEVLCNKIQLSLVFANLIKNSAFAVRNLKEKWIHIRAKKKEGKILAISVTDSGQGVPISIRDKILRPRFSTKGKSGLGLGLALSQSILKEHHGKILLDTQNKNTSFIVEINHS